MKNIVLIPIDNRPVCYELPKQITKLSDDYNLLLPEKNLLGSLNQIADCNILLKWLENLKDIDIIVISLDTIAYGGLIPSRRCSDSLSIIKSRIDKLAEILKTSKASVYAFSSIMRISNNNINEEEKEYWKDYGTKIFDYSYNFHKNGLTHTDIPEKILQDYLDTRKRNFEINRYYIELKKQGIFDTLVFSKDDCTGFGLNVMESVELKKLSENDKNIFIKTGADEIPLTLLSRALNSLRNIKISVQYTNPESISKISKYEDITVKESVESQIELAGGIASPDNEADMVLLVNNFKNEQGELVMNIKEPPFKGDLKLPGKPYFIADILNANGSDNGFVEALLKKEKWGEFYGYTAWNTTGNTLGSALASALTFYNAKLPNEKAFGELQLTRFLDDWAYQANVRAQIRINQRNLNDNIVKNKMEMFENRLLNKFSMNNYKIKYSFPWNRFFEIEIKLSL